MGKKSQPKGAESQGGKGGKGAGKGAKGAKSDAQSDAATGNPAKLKGCQIITARHILCAKQKKFDEAKAKLETLIRESEARAAGSNSSNEEYLSNFDAVAREFSEDSASKGGLLKPARREDLAPEFAEVGFSLPKSTTRGLHTGEARTVHGYHLIIVEERK